jgi:hypothetical protein
MVKVDIYPKIDMMENMFPELDLHVERRREIHGNPMEQCPVD